MADDEPQTDNLPTVSYSELAREEFGDDFHGTSLTERQEDEAYAQRMRGIVKLAEEKGKELSESSPETPVTDTGANAPQWSNEDLQILTAFQNDERILQAEVAKVQQAKQRLPQITDKGEAAALQTDIREAEQRLKPYIDRHEQNRQTISYNIQRRQIAGDQQKLFSEIPDLADQAKKEAFIGWGIKQGYTRDQILSERNPEILKLAWKAFQAEQGTVQQRKTIPKITPTEKQELEPLHRTGSVGSARSVKDAREALKASGKIEDALNLLTLRKQQRA